MTIETPEPDELLTAEANLKSLQASIAKFELELAPLVTEREIGVAERQRIKAEAEAKMQALAARDREITEAMYDAKRELTKLKREMESAERLSSQLKRAKDASNAYLVLEKQWDSITIGAPWREWAKDHQIEAAQKITYFGKMILADTMGLGKTLSATIAFDFIEAATRDASVEFPYNAKYERQFITSEYNADSGRYEDKYENVMVSGVTKQCGRKVLYFCPSTMIGNVRREINRWAPHRKVGIVGGIPKAQRKYVINLITQADEFVIICNYEAWRKDKSLIDDLIGIEFDTCIIDEAHNIKDRKSVAFRGIERILTESDIPFVVPMTGTPILNRPQELFALLNLVDRRNFHTENEYLRDYCEQDIYTGKWSFKYGGLDRLAKQISDKYLRRTKEQAGIILPPRTIVVHELEIDKENYPEQCRARDEMNKWGSIMLDPNNFESGAITAMAQIAVYTRLRQIEVWPAGIVVETKDLLGEVISTIKLNVEQSQKMDEIIHYNKESREYDGIIPEVVSDERVVVFSQFTKPLFELKSRLESAGYRVGILTGDTKDSEREVILKDFDAYYTPDRSQSKYDVVLAHYRVGGVGANLTAATQMIILDEEWNPGKRDQAYDRIHRIGQTKPTTIHVLRTENTIDDWLAKLIDAKEDMVQGFNTSADSMATELWKKLRGE